MIVFLDNNIYKGTPYTPFEIVEDNLFERKINLNAERGKASLAHQTNLKAKIESQKQKEMNKDKNYSY